MDFIVLQVCIRDKGPWAKGKIVDEAVVNADPRVGLMKALDAEGLGTESLGMPMTPAISGIMKGHTPRTPALQPQDRTPPPEEQAVQACQQLLQSRQPRHKKGLLLSLTRMGFRGICDEFLRVHFQVSGSEVRLRTNSCSDASAEPPFEELQLVIPEAALTFEDLQNIMAVLPVAGGGINAEWRLLNA